MAEFTYHEKVENVHLAPEKSNEQSYVDMDIQVDIKKIIADLENKKFKGNKLKVSQS